MTKASKGAGKWRALVLYVLVAPAALQLLLRLDAYFEFSGVFGRLLRAWENFIHGLWARLLDWLPQWIDLAANQIDGLTWCAAMLGAVVFADEPLPRASSTQAAVLFWLSFVCVAAIFLAPYAPTRAHAFELEAARIGVLGAVRTVLLDVVLWFVAVAALAYQVLDYRARNAGREMVPLGQHLEQAVGALAGGGFVGMMLGGVEHASAAAMDEMAAQLTGEFSWPVLWERLLEPMLFAIAFALTLLQVRRHNWPSMPRMIAAAAGVFIADRMVAALELWRPGLFNP